MLSLACLLLHTEFNIYIYKIDKYVQEILIDTYRESNCNSVLSNPLR